MKTTIWDSISLTLNSQLLFYSLALPLSLPVFADPSPKRKRPNNADLLLHGIWWPNGRGGSAWTQQNKQRSHQRSLCFQFLQKTTIFLFILSWWVCSFLDLFISLTSLYLAWLLLPFLIKFAPMPACLSFRCGFAPLPLHFGSKSQRIDICLQVFSCSFFPPFTTENFLPFKDFIISEDDCWVVRMSAWFLC